MLEFNGTIIVAMISFIVFMFLMNIVLYEPMRKIVEKRKSFIDANSVEVSENEEKTKNLNDEKEIKLETARNESRTIITDLTDVAKQKKLEVISKATKQTNEYLESTVNQLNNDVQNIKHEIKNEVVGLAQEVLQKISGTQVVLPDVTDEEYEKVINNES